MNIPPMQPRYDVAAAEARERYASSCVSPRFSVWCGVSFAGRCGSDKLDADDYDGEIWVKVTMPAILPVGQWVYLPTPKAWKPCTGELSGRIDAWHVVCDAIVCDIFCQGMHVDAEGVSELLEIGYQRDFPGELEESYRTLLR